MTFGEVQGEYADFNKSNIVIQPVAYDGTSTWIKGADKGPAAILEAAWALELFDIETGKEIYREGIHVVPFPVVPDSPVEMVNTVKFSTTNLIQQQKFVVTLGGEHSVSIGAINAHSQEFEDLSVLQLDAHADLREEYEGSRYNHACVMARVKEICPFVQVGIRSMCSEERKNVVPSNIFYAHELKENKNLFNQIPDLLSQNVYVTIDLDVFDPSIMPSTGTPEPGGLGWYEVLNFLKKVASTKNIVGFDVVELCPNKVNKAPDYLAAKLIYKLLGYIF